MDGRLLAFGALGALAATRVWQTGGANRRPVFRPFTMVPRGFTISPWPFVKGTIFQESGDPSRCDGLYHVTTNLPAVLLDGRLRARSQLREAAGLGGGLKNQAPDQVSVAVTFEAARRIHDALRMMARAVHGEIDAASAFAQMKAFAEPALGVLDHAIDAMMDGDEASSESTAARAFEADLAATAQEVLVAEPGPVLYDELRRYESLIANAVANWTYEGWIGEDESVCGATVGFTEPAARFRRVVAGNVGLVRLAAKKSAKVNFVPDECELRFRSDDLAIVGIWEGS